MLTKKQYDLLLYVHDFLQKNGVSPSFDEMRDELKLKSKSGVHRLIMSLVERGYIRRLPNRARALEILHMPPNLDSEKLPIRSRRVDIIEQQEKIKSPDYVAPPQIVKLPLYGRIAAGTPIVALRDENTLIDVPQALVGRGEYYALEIEGDSMIEAGIHDGDTVIIEKSDVARDGEIVVALVEDEEATLKKFQKDGKNVILHPANKDYRTRTFSANDVKVQGRLSALLRKYY